MARGYTLEISAFLLGRTCVGFSHLAAFRERKSTRVSPRVSVGFGLSQRSSWKARPRRCSLLVRPVCWLPRKSKTSTCPTHPPTHESRLFAHTARMYALVEGGVFFFCPKCFSVVAPTMLLDLRMGLASDGNMCTIILAGWTRIHFIPKRGGLYNSGPLCCGQVQLVRRQHRETL